MRKANEMQVQSYTIFETEIFARFYTKNLGHFNQIYWRLPYQVMSDSTGSGCFFQEIVEDRRRRKYMTVACQEIMNS